MAASPNPLQGSLFEESKQSTTNGGKETNNSIGSSENLSNQQLKSDASLRPRIRKTSKNPNQINDLDQLSNAEIEEPKWSHHNLPKIDDLTPALKHYVQLKIENPDRVLLYRLGDFFECFFEDAITLSQLLEITLTSKEGGKKIGKVPMAGIPHHASDRYCTELIKKGLSIAICDQLEAAPSKGNKLIKRGITRLITPGTIIEEGMLSAKQNNWLASVLLESDSNSDFVNWSLAKLDVSTGEFLVQEGKETNNLRQELIKLKAAEVISESKSISNQNWYKGLIEITEFNQTSFSRLEAKTTIENHYFLNNIDGLGIHPESLSIRTIGGLIAYLNKTHPNIGNNLKNEVKTNICIDFPQIKHNQAGLIIDNQTRRNLEITSTQKNGQFQGSLLWAIDKTLTAMGGRCIRRWLEEPLTEIYSIQSRQKIIGLLVESSSLRKNIRKILRAMGDLERLSGRAGAQQAGARDLIAIAEGINRLPLIKKYLNDPIFEETKYFESIINLDRDLIELASKINNEIIDNPPLSLTEGGLIFDGVNPILDGLRNQLDDHNSWLKSQEIEERKNSNINNLKLQYHRSFGYFLAVSKAKSINVPDHWIRRQTLTNEERFVTPELKEREGKIFQLRARISQLEYDLFCKLRILVGNKSDIIRKAAKAISCLDVLSGLAELAATNNYIQPKIIDNKDSTKTRRLSIVDGRHPVVEQILVDKFFVPNDIELGSKTDLIILSGPNASGKSCYLRQVGLLQIMAQIGSWIPAKSANIGIADQLFTRVGAVDDLASGQSTFMVEMIETAFILNNATENSLVLLDEIGRGTSTFDGLSIAWSVSEFLAKKIKSRSIFATHYHELNQISEYIENVENYKVVVEYKNHSLSFLHKVEKGGANKSYGIEAARLAGVPPDVVNNARLILKNLEKNNSNTIQITKPIESCK
ncbi:putative DNA mismatch repair protein [Prochlorococcus marinus str. NATL1A]|uniref:DNA mismatch repair protein MutS n=1 Tax=Prochlorococcus marinus (strain NATL1A) TaxID=167555 RepID=MUTS_PROM1|nr:DNA mismatch repair protein MutS [Prochlorococcus marinus]A2C5A9.1 RecName: Full=DNA mismatch repair protein MutS [Prochlorococcus marinus str. NATL1A]ABM76669.1 putative DNA mismatch repair protein [Prochlorococcus marinus str. NATL1A]